MSFWEGLLYVIWRGLAIGVIISAPMGPVGILCVQRTLGKGRRAGLFTGIGAAISDLLYCLLTGFGLSFIEEFLEKNQNIIQLIGSVVLIIFGIYLFRANPNRKIKKPGFDQVSPGKNILNGFLFTFSNPLIIFLIIGLFARFNFMQPDILAFHYVVGYISIFAGALIWWWGVTYIIDKIRAHFNIRSMYLINKITGVIIMIFGIVGIVTSITAFSNGETRHVKPLVMNSHRGYDSLNIPADSVLTISGNSDTSEITLTSVDGNNFLLEFRLRNLNNASGKSYQACTNAKGKMTKVMHPGWKLLLGQDTTPPLALSFETIDNMNDPLQPACIKVSVTYGDSLLSTNYISEGIDPYTGWNAYRIQRLDDRLIIECGDRGYILLPAVYTSGFSPAAISFKADPGALLNVDWIHFENKQIPAATMSHLANPDIRNSYMARSDDPMEGVWEMFDRSMDEDMLRPGGNYTLVLAKTKGGYDVIYLSGAVKNPTYWKPGMLKGRLLDTPFKNVYNVEWYDVNGEPIPTEGKAEYTSPSILSFQLPYFNSAFRLRKFTERH